MKNCLLIFFSLICKCAFSQLNDDFNDGNFTHNPSWKGDISSFSVNGTGHLQSNASQAGSTTHLVTANHLAKSARWEFYIRLDFDPSSTNRIRVYLISDKDMLTGPLEGYFIQIGEPGNTDSYDLYRQSGTSVVKILDGPVQPRLNPDQVICRLQVKRDEAGNWELDADSEGGYNFKPVGLTTDNTFSQTAWFGFACQFTTTRSDKFYLDDFKIEEWESNLPPAYEARLNDIVINEIFADPDPSVGLPDAEFIELWNRTGQNISLKSWTYGDASVSYRFLAEMIKAGEHLILCANADTGKFKTFDRVLGISPWPALNNTGDHLSLKDDKGRIINTLSYTNEWYRDGTKQDGGWTLELVDPNAVCAGIKNWLASVDTKGGTPGRVNSVYKLFDEGPPLQVSKVLLIDSITLAVTFNRFTDSLSAVNPGNYLLNNGVGKPLSAVYATSDQLTVALKLPVPLVRGKFYKLSAEGITDCSGAEIQNGAGTMEFFIPAEIRKSGILISEVLFNPRPAGVDFVEIYNNSGQELDLAELSISNVSQPDTLNRAKRISKDQQLIRPGEFMVLTSDPERVKNEYFTEKPNAFLKMPDFPAYNNDQGVVTLLKNAQIIDQFNYSEKMHMPLIKDPDGISLERSDYKKPADEPKNFRSAAASVGFATPGYQNSQYQPDNDSEDEFKLASLTFSPDNDGFEDEMELHYRLNKPGYIANITIFNDRGNVVRKLYQNYSLGTAGTLTWNGLDDTATVRTAGIYLLYAELFNTEGEIKKFRKTVVLAKKLN
ncbi:hypothetical protein GZH53_16490 [Flavihumibacter sp. R14]|nr:hypothetical protein [Flavihumibacter soli]